MEIILSAKVIKFEETVYEKKKVTRDDINMPLLSYYALSKYLKSNNLIEVNGVNDKNQHILMLTLKGKSFAELVVQIKSVLEEGEGL